MKSGNWCCWMRTNAHSSRDAWIGDGGGIPVLPPMPMVGAEADSLMASRMASRLLRPVLVPATRGKPVREPCLG